MSKTIHAISDKIVKIITRKNPNRSSKYFGRDSAIIECEKNNIFVQDDRELISVETMARVFASTLVGKTCIFRCVKVGRNLFLTEVEEVNQ